MKQKIVAFSLMLTLFILAPIIFVNPTIANSPTSNAVQSIGMSPADWPLFRHDAANTGSPDNNAPVTHDLLWSKNILVDQNAFSIVGSSPAIVNGVVYIGSDDGYLYAFNALNGDQVWSQKVGGSSVSSPAVVDGLVYVRDWYGSDYAFNASTGKEVWTYSAGWSYSSPAVDNGIYYARSSGYITALNASTGSLIWRSTLWGNGDGSPIIVDDTIYLAESGLVYALNAQDGSLKWSKDLQYASNTDNAPTVFNDILYISCQSETFFALDAETGDSIWNFTAGASPHSTAVISDGILYLGSGFHGVFALNAATGAQIWNYPISPGMGSSVAVAGENVYFEGTNGVMYALNTVTGLQIWSYPLGITGTTSSPSIANGILYIRSDNGYIFAFGKASAPSISLSPAFGLPGTNSKVSGSGFTVGSTITATFWRNPVILSNSAVDSLGHVSATFQVPDYSPYNYPIIVADAAGLSTSSNFTILGNPTTSWPMYMHDPQHSGTSDNIQPTSHDSLWTYSVDKGDIMNSIASSAAVVGGIVYGSSLNGFVYALNAYTGVCYWKFNVGGTHSSPAVVNGVVYVGGSRGLYAINAYTGNQIWVSSQAIDALISSPTVSGGLVYTGSFAERSFYAFSASDGQLVWQFQTGDYAQGSPTVIGNTVYASSYDGYLYALDALNGTLLWKYKCVESGDSLYNSPSVVDEVAYVVTYKGRLLALDAYTGNKIWNQTIAQAGPSSLPVYSNGTLYLSTQNGVYALDASSGQEIWCSTLSQVSVSPAIVGDVLYAGSSDGCVSAINTSTGTTLWQYQTGSYLRAPVSIANGGIYFGTASGKICAIGSPLNQPTPSPTSTTTQIPSTTPASTAASSTSTASSTSNPSTQQPTNNVDDVPHAPESPVVLIIGGLIGSIVVAGYVRLTKNKRKIT